MYVEANQMESGKREERLKILCLHGFRTNGSFLRKQLSKWDSSILAHFDMVILYISSSNLSNPFNNFFALWILINYYKLKFLFRCDMYKSNLFEDNTSSFFFVLVRNLNCGLNWYQMFETNSFSFYQTFFKVIFVKISKLLRS